MKRALLFLSVGVILLIGTATFIWPQLSLFLASNSCMDAGGSFDFSQLHCDFQNSHPYSTFNLWPFRIAIVGICAGIFLVGCGLLGLRPNYAIKGTSAWT